MIPSFLVVLYQIVEKSIVVAAAIKARPNSDESPLPDSSSLVAPAFAAATSASSAAPSMGIGSVDESGKELGDAGSFSGPPFDITVGEVVVVSVVPSVDDVGIFGTVDEVVSLVGEGVSLSSPLVGAVGLAGCWLGDAGALVGLLTGITGIVVLLLLLDAGAVVLFVPDGFFLQHIGAANGATTAHSVRLRYM